MCGCVCVCISVRNHVLKSHHTLALWVVHIIGKYCVRLGKHKPHSKGFGWRRWLSVNHISCRHPQLTPTHQTQYPPIWVCGRISLYTFFSLGCSSKFALPPWTVISSLGNSRFHSLVKSWTSSSGRVSYDNRTYWNKIKYAQFVLLVNNDKRGITILFVFPLWVKVEFFVRVYVNIMLIIDKFLIEICLWGLADCHIY